MAIRPARRRFLQATGLAALGLPSFESFRSLVHAEEPAAGRIRFGADLEPLVRLIEETPRDRCVAALAAELRRGLPYRRFVAGVFFTAVRKSNSHHSMYLVNSAHQVSLDLRPEERLLPLFWAVDHFKWQQHDFPSPPMAELAGPLPNSARPAEAFHEAMRRGRRDDAEKTIVTLARSEGPRHAMEHLWEYGCRDLSQIGHRAISLSSAWRVLQTLGWQHAEPALRFVVRDMGSPDRYYQPNLARVDRMLATLPPGWAVGRSDRGATLELFTPLRQGRAEAACDLAAQQVAGTVGSQVVWDAVHVAAAELLMLHPGSSGMAGRPLHINTAVNALHFAFRTARAARTRLLILLQSVAWVADFIRVHLGERAVDASSPLDLAGAELPETSPRTVDEIFSTLPPHTYDFDSTTRTGRGHNLADRAARTPIGRKVYALLTRDPEAVSLYLQVARSWLTVKATMEAHEYKLPGALFEDYDLVSAEWRPRLLASSAHWLHGRQSADSRLLQQAREAMRQ